MHLAKTRLTYGCSDWGKRYGLYDRRITVRKLVRKNIQGNAYGCSGRGSRYDHLS